MSSRRRSWPCFLPLAAALISIVLFYRIAPKLYSPNTWKVEDAPNGYLGTDDIQQVPGEVTPDDLSIRIHPEDHESRPPKIVRLNWNITKGERRPDGVAKEVYLVNGQFPGPLIEARSGDELIISVTNHLDGYEGTAVHWHGLDTPNDMDGSSGLTQCPIRPGKTFAYRMKIRETQSGTFWYHSHFETQRADGLYGPLVVHKPTLKSLSESRMYHYDHDQVLMVGDWYHRSAIDVLEQYDSWKRFKIEPVPDSLVLNGKGFFDCSMAVPARPVDCKKGNLPSFDVFSGRTRLRVINTGSLTGFSLTFVGYDLVAIKIDGGNDLEQSSPTRELGTLYPGERVDIVIERADPSNGAGRITVVLDQENIRYANQALRSTQQFAISSTADKKKVENARTQINHQKLAWTTSIDLSKMNGKRINSARMPRKASKTFLLYATMSYLAINSNRPKGSINHTSWTVSERFTPLLALDRSRWPSDPEPFVPTTDGAEWVDIVLNNFDDRGHPFHLHGHDFFVLAQHRPKRTGEYILWNPFERKEPPGGPINLVNPVKKDTVYVPSMGYVVLRVQANNPGLWLLHCHVLWHQSVGMGMAFDVGDSQDVETWKHLRDTAHKSCIA